ncbi:MAG TPA: helix-turn-helix transcriptional regulator [Clostridia bacterium]|nr:helix-turn-helix transcriptional regulator [Clostridia bacterium]
MPESHASRGTRRGRRLLSDLGAELRAARVAAGLTLAGVAAAAGISPSELSRIERGLAPWLSVLLAARLCSICGLDLAARAYPGGDPLHDAAHVRLFDSFQERVGVGIRRQSEVPVGDARDQRAWDQVLRDPDGSAAVEFETRLRDAQALLRRVNLKCRDSGLDRVMLVLADRRASRDPSGRPVRC